MSPDVLAILIAVLGFITVAGLGFVFVGGDNSQAKTAKRVQAVAQVGRADRVRKVQGDAAGLRRKQILDGLKANERQQRKEKLSIDARLAQAGLSFTSKQFYIGSAVFGVIVALACFVLRMAPVLAIGLGLASGLGMPRWMLTFLCKRRNKNFTEEFPGAIDIVVRGIKSGLPVNDCLRIIAREAPQPLAGEFTKVVENVGMGLTINEALEKMHTRMPTPEVRFLSIVMAIQSKTGGNLAEALNNLSTVLRARKLMREKVKAMSGEAIASAFIIGSLPPGIMALVSISSPGYMAPMFADPRGHMMLMGAFWMLSGIFVMRKMINFKIDGPPMIETITDPNNILAALVAVACFATLVTMLAPLMRGDRLDARLRSVATRRDELRRRSRAQINAARGGAASLRHSDEGLVKTFVDRLNLKKLLEDPLVVDKLAQAGFRGPRPVTIFYFFRFLTPFLFAAATAVYLYGINGFGLQPMSKLTACVAGFVAGYYGRNLYVTNIATKRRESIVLAFPDALDLLLICVESGMSIEAAIQKVSSEIGSSSIELAEELSLLTAELSYLPERRMAYEGLSRRINHNGVKGVMTAMIQAEKYGTPLGTALRVMAKENRDMRLATAEKKASSLPAKLTVPMVLFFLPVLFVVILGPAIIKVQDITHKPTKSESSAPAK